MPDAVQQLRVQRYDKVPWLGDDLSLARPEIGFIAQEVYEVPALQAAVKVGDDASPWGLNYSMITAVNSGAIKELAMKVQEQEARIARLEQLLGGAV